MTTALPTRPEQNRRELRITGLPSCHPRHLSDRRQAVMRDQAGMAAGKA